jgi:murein DD-endopeptidase MepM/ murein hydrolase activator NlpD
MGKSGNARGYHLHFELIDLQEIWNLEEDVDKIVEKILHGEQIPTHASRQLSKLLFSKQAKRDPLPYIPGLTHAKRKNGKWIPDKPVVSTNVKPIAIRRK